MDKCDVHFNHLFICVFLTTLLLVDNIDTGFSLVAMRKEHMVEGNDQEGLEGKALLQKGRDLPTRRPTRQSLIF